jgi:hypothetical protein
MSPIESQTSSPVMYIQIILQKTVNKKTYFLRAVVDADQTEFIHIHSTDSLTTCIFVLLILGGQCNYQVTCDDRAWNAFLK